MSLQSFNESPWLIDNYQIVIEQKAVVDADFVQEETYDGVVWDEFEEESTKQVTKRKYVSRRKADEIKCFKVCSGDSVGMSDIENYGLTGFTLPPECKKPSDSILYPNAVWEGFAFDWFLISINVQFTRDGNARVDATFKKYEPWELVFVGSGT